MFDSIEQMQVTAIRRLRTYRHERLHMILGGIPPTHELALAAWLRFLLSVKSGRSTDDNLSVIYCAISAPA